MLLSIIFVCIVVSGHAVGRVSLSTCSIECKDDDGARHVGSVESTNIEGRVGKQGPKGEKGDTGTSCDCLTEQNIVDRVSSEIIGKLGSWNNPIRNCSELAGMRYGNGLYVIEDKWGELYQTYCDFTTDGGGWTLVASIHENFMQGHCTLGDRWSSEHGNNASHPHGDGNWENFVTFGRASSATSEDFKSPAYWSLNTCDVMVWHVPNDTPLWEYEERAFMKYHTNDCALEKFENLKDLYSNHYPIRDKIFTAGDNGPAYPVSWNKGNNEFMLQNIVPNARTRVDAGFIQFRAVNNERGSLAFCPGIRIKEDQKAIAEHVCYGGSSYFSGHTNSHKYCGDFGARDYNGYATDTVWSANKLMSESVVMIFYR